MEGLFFLVGLSVGVLGAWWGFHRIYNIKMDASLEDTKGAVEFAQKALTAIEMLHYAMFDVNVEGRNLTGAFDQLWRVAGLDERGYR